MVDTDLPVLSYEEISALPATDPGPPHTLESLTHIEFYMDDVVSAVQGGSDQQH